MKKLILLAGYLMAGFFSISQTPGGNSIIGTVVSATSKLPLEYGTVAIYKKGSLKPINGTTTDKTGSFTLSGIPAGTFTLIIEYLGFKADTIPTLAINRKDAIIAHPRKNPGR